MKHLGKWKTQGLITLILVLLLLLMPFQDYTERTFLMDSMNYPEDLIGTLNTDEGTIQVPAVWALLCWTPAVTISGTAPTKSPST